MIAMFFIISSVGSLDYSRIAPALKSGIPHTTVDGDRGAALRRVRRQERADPVAHLAARRDGRPHPGLRAHPRGHDGDRRHLPGLPRAPVLRRQRRRAHRRRVGRGHHRAARRHRRARPARHQEGAGVLDDQPARLHVPRLRSARLPGRGVHGARARLLQGHALPRRRFGHPRQRGQPGPAKNGRAAKAHAVHCVRVRPRVPRDQRHPTTVRLLRQGRDHLGQLLLERLRPVDHRGGGRRDHGDLHDPRDAADVLRQRAVPRRTRREPRRRWRGSRSRAGRGTGDGARGDARRRGARRARDLAHLTDGRLRQPARPGEAHPRSARDAVDDGRPVDHPRRPRRGDRVHQPAVHQLRVPDRLARPGVPRRHRAGRELVPPGGDARRRLGHDRVRRHLLRVDGLPPRPRRPGGRPARPPARAVRQALRSRVLLRRGDRPAGRRPRAGRRALAGDDVRPRHHRRRGQRHRADSCAAPRTACARRRPGSCASTRSGSCSASCSSCSTPWPERASR